MNMVNGQMAQMAIMGQKAAGLGKIFHQKGGGGHCRKVARCTGIPEKKKRYLVSARLNSATEMRMLILALRVSLVAPGHDDLNSSRYQSTISCQGVLSGEEEGKT